jgi:hypothetical protein
VYKYFIPGSPTNFSALVDPLERSPIGDVKWLQNQTGWTDDKIWRLCRLKRIPGAYQASPRSAWSFRKEKVLNWLKKIES